MTDSDGDEALDAPQGRSRADRIAGVKRWVRHIEENPPEHWGPEQNAVVNAQVEAARRSGLDADHRRRVERRADELSEGSDR